MLLPRVFTACALLALFLSALFFLPNAWWMALIALVLAGAALEWSALSGLKGAARAAFVAAALASVLCAWAGLPAPAADRLAPVEYLVYGSSVAFWLCAGIPWLARGWSVRSPLALAATGWLLLVPTALALARLQAAPATLLTLMGIVWLADIAAYFSGRAWGRHKLAPTISPGKTWEGVAGAAAVVAVYYVVLGSFEQEWYGLQGAGGAALFAGVMLMSVVGDLFESWIKRQAGVKDSGSLLPGHGGILDRIDGVTASLPLAALLLPCLR